MPLCWIQSQDITIDGTVTVDNTVIEPGVDSTQNVLINKGYLPLWLTTIYELQKAETVIDSLRLAYTQAVGSSKYYSLQADNLTKQKTQMQRIIDNLNEQIKFSEEANWETKYQAKKWRRIARWSMIAGGGFAVLWITK